MRPALWIPLTVMWLLVITAWVLVARLWIAYLAANKTEEN